jgi:hypothetical protein
MTVLRQTTAAGSGDLSQRSVTPSRSALLCAGDDAMHIFDYIAIGVLIALALVFALWMRANWKSGSRH